VPDKFVSIVVITYNSSKFVLETLESCKNQTYKNIELIISDDKSTDDTIDKCKKWIDDNGEHFIRCLIIESTINTGIPANCNRGVKASNGEWIKLIAGDDALFENCIDDNLNYVLSHPDCEAVFSQCEQYRNDFREESKFGIEPSDTNRKFLNHNTTPDEQFELLIKSNQVYAPSIFLSKKLLIEIEMFDESFTNIEDYPLWLKITRNGFKIHFFPKVTVKHRWSSSSVHSNDVVKRIYSKTFFETELVRRKYAYPYQHAQQNLYHQYRYFIRVLLKKINLNQDNVFCIILDRIVTGQIFTMLNRYVTNK
jgi:alpha-1,3-rhamnosyltransferase